ncbi:MAG: macro domain-containing protein, partial [Desulfovibrionaceae bacterium]
LAAACRAIVAERGPLAAGEAVLTPGFRLAARYIIHTVGPVWGGGGRGEPRALRRAYESCLALAREHALASLAFPAVSCGAYGYPVALAAPIALAVLAQGLNLGHLREARMVLRGAAALAEWTAAAEGLRVL